MRKQTGPQVVTRPNTRASVHPPSRVRLRSPRPVGPRHPDLHHLQPRPVPQGSVAKVKEEDRKKGLSSSAHLTIKGRTGSPRSSAATSRSRSPRPRSERERARLPVDARRRDRRERVQRDPQPGGLGLRRRLPGQVQGLQPAVRDQRHQGHGPLLPARREGLPGGRRDRARRSNSDWTPGKIALQGRGSRSNFSSDAAAEGFYQQNINEATAILDAWGGASKTYTVRESYEFRAGEKDHDRAAARTTGTRPAGSPTSVRWRRFASRNGCGSARTNGSSRTSPRSSSTAPNGSPIRACSG
jgi:hypothetical protein